MLKRKTYSILIALIFLLAGCGRITSNTEEITNNQIVATESQVSEDLDMIATSDARTTETQLSTIPDYSGSPSVEVDGNIPNFTDEDKKRIDAFEEYSELDSLGRCGVAYANICPELQPTKERGEIGSIKPSGWNQAKYEGVVNSTPPYLYNRCHLIAYCLAGENANEKNLITGTRYLNIEGMLPYEEMVNNYVKQTGNHVLYRVTPIYKEADDLIASIVEMEGWSVEDEGAGICFHVYCYNVQPGIIITYKTGESCLDNNYQGAGETSSLITETNDEETSRTETYILNTNTKKIHREQCSSVPDIKEQNKKLYQGTIEELENEGYTRCKRCNP